MSFFIFYAPGANFSHAERFSPRAMAWAEHIWLLDLGPTERFWQARSQEDRIPFAEVLRKMLSEVFGPEGFVAVLSDSAWAAIISLSALRARGMTGILHGQNAFGMRFFAQISWEEWLGEAAVVVGFLESAGLKKAWLGEWFREQKRLLPSLRALGIKSLGDLERASPAVGAIKRRFGHVIAALWEWTEHALDAQRVARAPIDFPWVSFVPAHQPSIREDLDDPLLRWEDLAPFLALSFDKLARQMQDDEAALLCSWRVQVFDGSEVYLSLNFRYPHLLRREMGHQQTALYQAELGWAAKMREIATEEQSSDVQKSVISWSLEVLEKITLEPQMRDLFGEFLLTDKEREAERLCNQSGVPLQRFALEADWVPESSFYERLNGKYLPKSRDFFPWEQAAAERPMFYLEKPKPLEKAPRGPLVFLERICLPWWNTDFHSHRDYFKNIDPRTQKIFWLFRDEKGEWYEHGIFG